MSIVAISYLLYQVVYTGLVDCCTLIFFLYNNAHFKDRVMQSTTFHIFNLLSQALRDGKIRKCPG